jgi:hypothetical protein
VTTCCELNAGTDTSRIAHFVHIGEQQRAVAQSNRTEHRKHLAHLFRSRYRLDDFSCSLNEQLGYRAERSVL